MAGIKLLFNDHVSTPPYFYAKFGLRQIYLLQPEFDCILIKTDLRETDLSDFDTLFDLYDLDLLEILSGFKVYEPTEGTETVTDMCCHLEVFKSCDLIRYYQVWNFYLEQ